MTAQIFEKLRADYESGDHDLGAFIRSLKTTAYVMKKKYDVDIDWLSDAALHHLKAKTKTYIQDKRIGLLAALLVGHGSSFNQVMQALGEWLDLGDTKIKNAYYAVNKDYDLPKDERNLDCQAFMKKAEIIPYIVMLQSNRPFPKRYEKAYDAFLKAYHQAEASHVEQIIRMATETGNLQISFADIEERKEIIRDINQSYLL